MGNRGPKPQPLADRFWPKVERRRHQECWPWTWFRTSGYGRISVEGRSERAHRVAWLLSVGPIPKGMHVCHQCDNPACCNPRHLFLGNAALNAADRTAKGRSRGGRLIGERHHQAKLTWAKVEEIRRLYLQGIRARELRQRYGMSQKAIWCVTRGVSWRDRPEAEHQAGEKGEK